MNPSPDAAAPIEPARGPEVLSPRATAFQIGVSASMLRKLTIAGEIGHVRLGTGSQRQRIGYTQAQVDAFIAARTVPAKAAEVTPTVVVPARQTRRRRAATPAEGQPMAARSVQLALNAGTITEWRNPR